jgi:hypothetical protein
LDRENIHKALRILFLSSNYWQTPLSSGPDSLRLRLSGYRFLTRSHFESIASDLLGDHSISFSNEINPLVSGDVDSERQIPGSAYFAAVNDGVRALAKALVEREFSLSADARKLFSMLPDGAASEPSASLLRETIAQLWEFLTGEETNVTSDEVTQLASLFETVLGIDDQVSAAWEAVLVGIMLDPKFLSY